MNYDNMLKCLIGRKSELTSLLCVREIIKDTMEKIANQLEHIRTKLRFFGSEVWELF